MHTIYSIQALRALAAFSVMLFHIPLFRIGEAGVDIFFVISGFIMGLIGRHERPSRFLLRRVVRLVPLYWAVTLLMCAASLVPHLFNRFHFDAQSLAFSLLFIPYYNDEGQLWPLVVPGWTLNAEMLFYTVFSLGLCIKHPLEATTLILAACIIGISSSHAVLTAWSNPILAEFIAGLWLSEAFRRDLLRLPWLWLMLSAAGYGWLYTHPEELGGMRVLYAGLPALALVTAVLTLEKQGRWRRFLWIERIGDASYSLYLTHGLILAALHKRLPADPLWQWGVMVPACILAALLCYRFIEQPLTRFLHLRLLLDKTRNAYP